MMPNLGVTLKNKVTEPAFDRFDDCRCVRLIDVCLWLSPTLGRLLNRDADSALVRLLKVMAGRSPRNWTSGSFSIGGFWGLCCRTAIFEDGL